MGLINWTSKNVTEDMIDVSSETLVKVLAMAPLELQNRWTGKLMYTPNTRNVAIRVELRKQMNGTSVLIKIHSRSWSSKDKIIQITMNQALQLTVDEMDEMRMVIDEGIAVYKHPALWIKLNEYKEKNRR